MISALSSISVHGIDGFSIGFAISSISLAGITTFFLSLTDMNLEVYSIGKSFSFAFKPITLILYSDPFSFESSFPKIRAVELPYEPLS